MVTLNKYEIDKDKITIYPNRQIKILVYTLFFVFIILTIGLFVGVDYQVSGKLEINPAIISMIGFLILMLVPFLPIMYRKVIVNFRERKISTHSAFIKWKEYNFSEIESIKPIAGDALYYGIFLHTDKLGKGIRISPHYTSRKQHEREEEAFKTEVIIPIQAALEQKTNTPQNPIKTIRNFHFFQQRGAEFTNRQYHFIARFIGISLLIGVIFLQINMWGHNSGEDILLRVLSCIFPLSFLLTGHDKIHFDTNTATLTTSKWFGLLKSTYNLNNFTGFQSIRNSVNFIYTGTELVMYFEENEKENKVSLIDYRNTKKLSQYHEEVVEIMKKTFPTAFNQEVNQSNSFNI